MNNPSLEQFLNDVKLHKLSVNLDQGVYRDITVKNPNTVAMHYNITTRPGYLMITGDMGSFVFTRLNDMFKFFRSDDGYEINPGSWEEKLEAVNRGNGAQAFSVETVSQILKDHLNDHLEGLDCGHSSTDEEKAEEAKEAIQNLIGLAESDEHDFYSKLREWDPEYDGGVDMECWWEWDFKDYTYHYIWFCYAIVHAIKLYDAYVEESLKEMT